VRRAEGKVVADRAYSVFAPYELLGALQGRNVGFVVIGAFARVVHGTRELTDGIDITPTMREENLARLAAALEDLVPEPAGTGGYDDLRRRADREPLGRGLRPQVASTEDLARMLGALDHEPDDERLLRLRRLMNLERKLVRELGRDGGLER
jgi:hypothetical protein